MADARDAALFRPWKSDPILGLRNAIRVLMGASELPSNPFIVRLNQDLQADADSMTEPVGGEWSA